MNVEGYRRLLAGGTGTSVLAGHGLWRLSGPDRERYLNGQVTRDVASLPDGEAALAAVCTAKGRMEGSVWIAVHGDAFYLDADPALHESLGLRLEKYLISDDATLEDFTDAWSLSHVFGSTPPPRPDAGFVVRHARYGLPGHDVWNCGPGTVVVGDHVENDVVEALRLEYAIPRWGAELTAQTLPPEAGPVMLEAISYTKGCYVGQETIARLKSIGHVNRTLVLLRTAGQDVVAPGTKLRAGEKEAGTVTSSGFSPRLGTGIALAYVPPTLAEPGSVLHAGEAALTVIPPLVGLDAT